MAVTPISKDGIIAFVKTYLDALKQAGQFSPTAYNLFKLTDKVGEVVMLKGDFSDSLPELEGNKLDAGKIVEETMINLILPIRYGKNGTHPGVQDEENATTEGAGDLAPAYPSIEDAAYSYDLGRVYIKVTRPYGYVEAGVNSTEQAARLYADILWAFESSASVFRFNLKKQLLANAISKAEAVTGLSQELAMPVDELTSEAFIKQIKKDVEKLKFPGDKRTLAGTYVGASPELLLIVKAGIMPNVEVDALAGCFQLDKLALPCRIKVVDDFAGDESGAWGVLFDPRGIKLKLNYEATRETPNGQGDFVNYYRHLAFTGFISKHVPIKVYFETPAESEGE